MAGRSVEIKALQFISALQSILFHLSATRIVGSEICFTEGPEYPWAHGSEETTVVEKQMLVSFSP
jgi:hypothetical protein